MNDWLVSMGVELDILPHLIALMVAYVLALPIGWDREQNERSAGLRTFWSPSPHAVLSSQQKRSHSAMRRPRPAWWKA